MPELLARAAYARRQATLDPHIPHRSRRVTVADLELAGWVMRSYFDTRRGLGGVTLDAALDVLWELRVGAADDEERGVAPQMPWLWQPAYLLDAYDTAEAEADEARPRVIRRATTQSRSAHSRRSDVPAYTSELDSAKSSHGRLAHRAAAEPAKAQEAEAAGARSKPIGRQRPSVLKNSSRTANSAGFPEKT